MSRWNAQDMPDQTGRRAIVTGANSGLGWHVSTELARKGASVILACRSEERGGEALQRLRAEVPEARVDCRRLDLTSLDSIRAFVADVDEPVDILVNNAGVMATPHRRTADGFELQLGTNHLGHFALTGLLMPRLLDAPDTRVVTVSSGAHRMGKMDFDDLQSERSYGPWQAYGQSKLANLLFMQELQRRADQSGAKLTSTGAHPGYAATNLQTSQARNGSVRGRIESLMMWVSNKVVAQSDRMGALPLLYAATMDIPAAAYVGPDGLGEQRGHPTLVGMTRAAQNLEDAQRLWEVSEELTGVRYAFAATTPA